MLVARSNNTRVTQYILHPILNFFSNHDTGLPSNLFRSVPYSLTVFVILFKTVHKAFQAEGRAETQNLLLLMFNHYVTSHRFICVAQQHGLKRTVYL